MEFPNWSDAWFLLFFTFASLMGFILTFSIIFCTKHNSALTTTVIGVLKVTAPSLSTNGNYLFVHLCVKLFHKFWQFSLNLLKTNKVLSDEFDGLWCNGVAFLLDSG